MSLWIGGGATKLVVLQENDFLALCRGDLEISFKPTRSAEKIAKGKVPTLMRESE